MFIIYGLTFDHTTNYGSCFQAYALQQAIEKIAVDGEKCSYFLIPLKTIHRKTSIDISVDNFIKHIKGNFRNFLSQLQRHKFVPFEKQYMKYANCYSMKDLPLLNEKADAFVCGSDVIWNPNFNNNNGVFFLDFARKYKFSYAASFGKTEVSKEYMIFAGEKLASFDSISVREKSSLNIIEKSTDKTVEIVSDPVLLLDTEEWKGIMDVLPKYNKYIFVYTTHLNDTFKAFLQVLEKLTGLQVITSAWSMSIKASAWSMSIKEILKQRSISGQTPQEWLSLLYHAEYVVTNSFHASVFSVLFHKKFFTVVAGDKAQGINARMNDFLQTVGLEDRIYSSVPETIDMSEIDFTYTDAVIARMRSESLAYLQRNIEDAYRRKTANSYQDNKRNI